jgi:stage II sporulation protein D
MRTVFLISTAILLYGGCTSQKIIPPTVSKKIPIIRVALDDTFSKGKLLFQTPYKLSSEEAAYILDASLGEFEVYYSGQELIIKNSERWLEFKKFDRLEFVPIDDGIFKWNGIPYQGILVFQRNRNSLLVINILPLPEYLKGVVPHEIPSYTEEYYQAVLAQAIAARTYALFQIEHSPSSDFDLYADTRDQVYEGQKFKAPLAEKAIKESFGLILQDDQNNLRKIQYHSTCGGMLHTEYLSDTPSHNQTALKDFSSDDFNCMASPLYRWISKVTIREILANLSRLNFLSSHKQPELEEEGFEMQIEIISRKASGRVSEMSIQIDNEVIKLNDWQIRQVFSNSKNKPLPSTLFLLKSSPTQEGQLYIIGAGYGHGRGMCQWGAIGQSLNGTSFKEILYFYYPGLLINKIY